MREDRMERIGRWALLVLAVMLVTGIAVRASGPGADARTVIIRGRVVQNAASFIGGVNDTWSAQVGQDPKECYFFTNTPQLMIGCGGTGTGYGPDIWALFSYQLIPDGDRWTATGLSGRLGDGTQTVPSGTQLVTPISWKGYVDGNGKARVTRVTSTSDSVGYSLVDVALIGLVVLGFVALVTRDPRRRTRERRARAPGVARGQRAWDAMRELSAAPPILPPSPVMVERPAPRPAAPDGWGPPAGPVVRPEPVAIPAPPTPARTEAPAVAGPEERPKPPARTKPVDDPEPPEVHWSGPAVLLLGSVEPVGWAQVPDRQVLVELVAFLVTHQERPVKSDELREAVWGEGRTGDRSVGDNTVSQSMSRLRKCLGPGHLPDASGGAGYRLAGTVTSDWFRFQSLVEAARRSDDQQVGELLRQALALVRGRPFASVPRRTYCWVWDETLAAEMEAAVSGAATWAADWFIEHEMPRVGEWAARRGLLAVPGDETLLVDRLVAVSCYGDLQAFERAWRDTQEAVGPDGISANLRREYEGLRGTYFDR